MQFIISGSVDSSSAPTPLGSYRACVTGTVSIGDTARNTLAALRNEGTGSIDLDLRRVRVHVSPKAQAAGNDVCFVLGARASGSAAGSTVAPTTLEPAFPTSNAVAYRTPTGLTLSDPSDGFLVQAQAANLNNAPQVSLVVESDGRLGGRNAVRIEPGSSYAVSLSELIVGAGGATAFAFIVEFGWDEVA